MATVAIMLITIPSLYQSIYDQRYAHLTAEVIILYEYLITFDQEVDLIWTERWSFVKILFLMNRYYGLAALIFDNYGTFSHSIDLKVSRQYTIWEGMTDIFVNLIAQGFSQLRIYALYPDNRLILGIMLTFFLSSFAASAVLMWLAVTGIELAVVQIIGQHCVATKALSFGQTVWIPIFVFEGFLCALVVMSGCRTRKPFELLSFQKGCQRLADVLFRDSIIYFAAIAATHLTCFFICMLHPELGSVPLAFAVAVPCVMSSRLIFNLRATASARTVLMSGDAVLGELADSDDTGPITFAITPSDAP
ncbi:hypothetical protein CPC08DRAFT_746464 [Agrocybe pediades]|nr:hypothetical protein CPC08DRAFT_746464 [Agrocybe pediades]